ncbi:DUF4440 domain-containing protein [Lysobacter sp. F60174L2]|uniref:DUF4440 domain-containing protein n=1 Tax=Lysobacter sp. F60174L2 TaxID=3459295 RepID=UPI00403DD0B5
MKPDTLWSLEEGFWRGGADFYERTLAPEALMVLPAPTGVLDRDAAIASIRSAARWQHVAFEHRHQVLAGDVTAVLAYAVRADRGSADTAYAAQCSSTYVHSGDRWQLVLHHQTPAWA